MNKKIALLNKLIEKTKDNSLDWVKMDNFPHPLKTYSYEYNSNAIFPTTLNTFDNIDSKRSYACNFNDGQIFLLLQANSFDFDMKYDLVLQTSSSPESILYVSSLYSNDKELITLIKRLYNLVVEYTPSEINSFIDSILNS